MEWFIKLVNIVSRLMSNFKDSNVTISLKQIHNTTLDIRLWSEVYWSSNWIGKQIKRQKANNQHWKCFQNFLALSLSFYRTKQALKVGHKMKSAKSLFKFFSLKILIKQVNLGNRKIEFEPRNLFNIQYYYWVGAKNVWLNIHLELNFCSN